MGEAVYAINDFPDDDWLWRIEWIGGVAYNASVPSDPQIDVCLAQLPAGETNPLTRIIHQACEGSERGAARSARRRESQIGGDRVNFLAVTGLDGGSETTVGASTGHGSACSPCSASEQERSPSCSGQVTPAPAVHRARERKSAAQGKARGSCTTIRRTDWRTRAATLSRRRRMVSNCCAPSSLRSA
jgi:hypothetical protein